jgi:hypothetical protein
MRIRPDSREVTMNEARLAKLRKERDKGESGIAAEHAEEQRRKDNAEARGKREGTKWADSDTTKLATMRDLSAGSAGAIASAVWPGLLNAGFATDPELRKRSGPTSVEAVAYQAAFIEAVNEALRKVDEDR